MDARVLCVAVPALALAACSLSDGDTPYASLAEEGDSGDSTDSGQGSDTDTDAPVDTPPSEWTDPAYWADPGPLAGLILPETADAGPHWEVRVATSPDGDTWTADERVIAQGLSGLSMVTMADRVVITGNVDVSQAEAHGIPLAHDAIYAISSAEFTTWTSTAWTITAMSRQRVIDPAFAFDLDGSVRAVWFGTDELTAAAEDIGGVHEIFLASWDGAGFAEDLMAWTADTLSEPAVCRLDDQLWMFATNEYSTLLALNAGADGQWELIEDRLWEGAVSPSCVEQADSIGLVAGVDGAAKVRDLLADGTLGTVDQLAPAGLFGDPCTSPALTEFAGGWVYACAIWVE